MNTFKKISALILTTLITLQLGAMNQGPEAPEFSRPTTPKVQQLTSFHEITGLSMLSQYFFKTQEFTHNTINWTNPPAHTNFTTSPSMLNEAVETFKRKFNACEDFNNPGNWLHEIQRQNLHAQSIAQWNGENLTGITADYVQKITVPDGSTVAVMGDIHGSMHSLLRNLWRLVALGYLDEKLNIIKPNFYMVFLGDFVDRGAYGLETLITLIKLKTQGNNWGKVHILAGNHERPYSNLWICDTYGFKDELIEKYPRGPNGIALQTLENVAQNFFANLPVALFVTCGTNTVQYCHGGIEPTYSPKALIDSDKNFEYVAYATGLYWSDFCQLDLSVTTPNKGRGDLSLHMCPQAYTKKYLTQNNLSFIFRGHQDKITLGLFYENKEWEKRISNRTLGSSTYADLNQNLMGPYPWYEVLNIPKITREQIAYRFNLNKLDYYPVATLSTAGIYGTHYDVHDCFGVMSTSYDWNQWWMTVYDILWNEAILCDIERGNPPGYTSVLAKHSREPEECATRPLDPIDIILLPNPPQDDRLAADMQSIIDQVVLLPDQSQKKACEENDDTVTFDYKAYRAMVGYGQ